MSLSARLLLSGVAAAATVAIAAPVASADTVSAPNVCYSQDGNAPQYGNLPLQLTPASVTQNGRQLDVGQIQPAVTVPSWLKDKLNSVGAGLLLGSSKSVPVSATMALVGNGSTDAPQIVTTTGTVVISVKNLSVAAVSLVLNPAGATSWHAPDAGGTLSVAQAGPGSLVSVPALGGKPKGSLYVTGTVNLVGSSLAIAIDCQPGTNTSPEDPASLTAGQTPGAPVAFASSTFSLYTPPATPTPTATPIPTPAPTPAATPKPTPSPAATTKPLAAAGSLAIVSPTLKFGSAAVLVNVSCPAGGADCAGSAVITSAKKLKVGKGPAKVRKLAAGWYSVKAGTTAPVKLKLSADGKKLRAKPLVATVTLKPDGGAAVVKNLRANG